MCNYQLKRYMWLVLGIVLYGLLPITHVHATPTAADCPSYSNDDFVLRSDPVEIAKFNYAAYCKGNERNSAPSAFGPYETSSPSPPMWDTKAAMISEAACDVEDPETEAHPQMSWYILPKDCVDKGIEFRNFYVVVDFDLEREGHDCNIDPSCVANFSTTMYPNDTHFHWATMTEYKAEIEGDLLCVYTAYLGFIDKRFLDCRQMPEPPPLRPPQQACWVAGSCTSWDAIQNQWFVPMSALVVQCVVDTINGIFVHGVNFCPPETETVFQRVQGNVRQTIRIVLILYIVVMGFKIALGEMHSKKDIMEMLFKFAFVMYFAVGEGWQDYFLSVTGAATDLARLVFSGAVSQYNMCNFPLPAQPYESGYEWMALWDTIDCKLYYYMGFRQEGYPKFILVALANILGFAFFIIFLTVTFIIMFIKIIIYAVRMYCMVIFAVAILIYISPLIFPMLLFKSTSSYFRKWLDELIGYVLYPMVMFAAIGLLITVFDSVYWGDATMSNFDPTDGSITIDCGGTSEDDPEVDSAGCHVERASFTRFLGIPVTVGFSSINVLLSVLKISFFAYLFAAFLGNLNEFIGGLTGTFRTAAKIAVAPPDQKDLLDAAKVGAVAGAGSGIQAALMIAGGEDKKKKGGEKDGEGGDGDEGGGEGGEGGATPSPTDVASGGEGGGQQGGGGQSPTDIASGGMQGGEQGGQQGGGGGQGGQDGGMNPIGGAKDKMNPDQARSAVNESSQTQGGQSGGNGSLTEWNNSGGSQGGSDESGGGSKEGLSIEGAAEDASDA